MAMAGGMAMTPDEGITEHIYIKRLDDVHACRTMLQLQVQHRVTQHTGEFAQRSCTYMAGLVDCNH